MKSWGNCPKFKVNPTYRAKFQNQRKHRMQSLVICPNTGDSEGHSVISRGGLMKRLIEAEGMAATRVGKRCGDAGQGQHSSEMERKFWVPLCGRWQTSNSVHLKLPRVWPWAVTLQNYEVKDLPVSLSWPLHNVCKHHGSRDFMYHKKFSKG